ncbi:MAG: hypothetical protein Kow00107_08110 [Planctomycetota bacterium]
MKAAFVSVLAFFLMFAVGCGDVVITINFPAAAIEKTAEDVVRTARAANEEAPDTDNDGISRMDGIDIDKANKEIDEIKTRMADRYEKHLLTFYDKGNVGEKIDGYVDIRNNDGLDIKQKAELKKLVNAENEDRKTLYKLVAEINKVPDDIDKVAKIFAKKFREKAKSTHWVQDDNGKWMTKKDYDDSQKKDKK